MRKSLLLFSLCFSVQCTLPRKEIAEPKPERVPTILVTKLVENNLDFLYFAIAERQPPLEGWFCMHGFVDEKSKDTLIQNISPIWIDSANGENVSGRPWHCPRPGTVATVHFHPGINFCSLSDLDVRAAHFLPYPLTAIVCRAHKDSLPKIVFVHRKEFDVAWEKLAAAKKSSVARSDEKNFTPTYRSRRP